MYGIYMSRNELLALSPEAIAADPALRAELHAVNEASNWNDDELADHEQEVLWALPVRGPRAPMLANG